MALLLEAIVDAIVDDKESVGITIESLPNDTVLRFSTADEDAGKVIGRGGENISAISKIMIAAARTRGVHVRLVYVNDRSAK